MGLSVILITYNEESNIRDCLESVRFADEIVVVDATSTDKTVDIARNYTDKVIVVDWCGYVEAKRLAIENATNEWIFWIDADERVTDELKEEMLSVLQNDMGFSGFKVCRKNYFLGRFIRHSGWYPDYVIRLFKRSSSHFTDSLVHEKVIVRGKVGVLQNHLLHFTYPTIRKYFEKFNRYTSLASEELKRNGERFSLFKLVLRPVATFIRMYILKLGFLDGIEGFLLALFSSFYVLVKYAKLKFD